MNVLDEAAQLINGERQQQYGDASESHQRIADLWASYLGTDVTEFDVVNMMILLKVSRTRNQYHRDSYVDIAGYSALGERLHQQADGTGAPVELHVEGFEDIFIPNVWDSLGKVPMDVVVADRHGDPWKFVAGRGWVCGGGGGEWWESHRPDFRTRYGPDTEVLEDK